MGMFDDILEGSEEDEEIEDEDIMEELIRIDLGGEQAPYPKDDEGNPKKWFPKKVIGGTLSGRSRSNKKRKKS